VREREAMMKNLRGSWEAARRAGVRVRVRVCAWYRRSNSSCAVSPVYQGVGGWEETPQLSFAANECCASRDVIILVATLDDAHSRA